MKAYYDTIAHLYTQARTLPYYLSKDYTYFWGIKRGDPYYRDIPS